MFLRGLEAVDKAAAIRSAVEAETDTRHRFEIDATRFSVVAGAPFAYWVSEDFRRVFDECEAFEAPSRTARVGIQTSDDARFMRLSWEIGPRASNRWPLLAKGGSFSPFYVDPHRAASWAGKGREVRSLEGARVQNADFYLKPGLTWPLRGIRFSAQAVGQGCMFDVAGKMAFVPPREGLWWLALFNSVVFDKFIGFFAGKVGGVQYQVGLIQQMPVPDLTAEDEEALAALARRAWSLKRTLDTRTETSHAFTLPALLQVEGATLADRTAAWSEHVEAIETELGEIQAEIDERCFELYGIGEEDRRAITEGFGATGTEGEQQEPEEDEDGTEALADQQTLAAELVSWAVGVAFGRFDIRLATGARKLPEEPEPFDPLPVCSAAMLTGDDGLPLAAPPPDYPVDFPTDGILVDDEGHERDLTAAVHAVIDEVFGTQGSDWWQELSAALDPKGHDLRTWIAGKFFGLHLKSHSKSRRKAPIVWQLTTPSKRYSVWLYVHRLTADSLFQLQGDIVAPKLDHEGRRLNNTIQDAQGSPSAKERKEIDKQEQLMDELRAMQAEVKLVAPLWRPELDDGIVLIKAPLRNLTPHHKPWQRELTKKWSELAKGKYDWAQIAMHLWPERVVPKCAADRSLAIAHDLEEVFWFEGEDGKWHQRETPTRPIDELVSELRSPAVEAALEGVRE